MKSINRRILVLEKQFLKIMWSIPSKVWWFLEEPVCVQNILLFSVHQYHKLYEKIYLLNQYTLKLARWIFVFPICLTNLFVSPSSCLYMYIFLFICIFHYFIFWSRFWRYKTNFVNLFSKKFSGWKNQRNYRKFCWCYSCSFLKIVFILDLNTTTTVQQLVNCFDVQHTETSFGTWENDSQFKTAWKRWMCLHLRKKKPSSVTVPKPNIFHRKKCNNHEVTMNIKFSNMQQRT